MDVLRRERAVHSRGDGRLGTANRRNGLIGLPSAAQRLIEPDQLLRGVLLRLDVLGLQRIKLTFRVYYV